MADSTITYINQVIHKEHSMVSVAESNNGIRGFILNQKKKYRLCLHMQETLPAESCHYESHFM